MPESAVTLSPSVLDAAYEIWAAFQEQFTGGVRPPRTRWDLLILARDGEPEPFVEVAIVSAVAAQRVFLQKGE